jgi:hypothetical protein
VEPSWLALEVSEADTWSIGRVAEGGMFRKGERSERCETFVSMLFESLAVLVNGFGAKISITTELNRLNRQAQDSENNDSRTSRTCRSLRTLTKKSSNVFLVRYVLPLNSPQSIGVQLWTARTWAHTR